MAKVSTKKKANADFGSMDLSFPDIEDTTPDTEPKTEKKDDQNALLASLQAQVAELSRRSEELQRTNMALLAQPVQQTQLPAEASTQVDTKGLPDPTLEPERYAEELNRRISASIEARVQHAQASSQQYAQKEGKVNALWTEFAESYEDYADDPTKVDFIAQSVVKKMRSRGVDPEKYMFQARDTFFQDVVSEYDKVFGKPGVEAPAKENDEEPASRTGGILGGLESGHAPSGSNEPKSDMVTEMQNLQRKSGFY